LIEGFLVAAEGGFDGGFFTRAGGGEEVEVGGAVTFAIDEVAEAIAEKGDGVLGREVCDDAPSVLAASAVVRF